MAPRPSVAVCVCVCVCGGRGVKRRLTFQTNLWKIIGAGLRSQSINSIKTEKVVSSFISISHRNR